MKRWIWLALCLSGCNLAPQRHVGAPTAFVDSPINPYCMLACKSNLTVNIHDRQDQHAPPPVPTQSKGKRG